MMWTFADAVNLALDMYKNGEIEHKDLDKVATELWQEMQSENTALVG